MVCECPKVLFIHQYLAQVFTKVVVFMLGWSPACPKKEDISTGQTGIGTQQLHLYL